MKFFRAALVGLLALALLPAFAGAQSLPSPAYKNLSVSGDLNAGTQSGTGAVAVPVQKQINNTIFVDQFGATGGNASTDAANIQKAIDYAASVGGGTVKLVRGKNYLINVSLFLRKGVTLDGVCSTVPNDTNVPYLMCARLTAAANMAAVITQADITTLLHSAGIKNLVIDGNKANYTVGNLVNLSLVNGIVDNNNISNGSGNCFYLHKNAIAAWINWITNNTIASCNGTGLIFEGSDSRIDSNYFSGNGYDVLIAATGAYSFANNMVDNTTIGSGLEIRNSSILNESLNSVVGNYFNNNSLADILVSKDSTYSSVSFRTTITGNVFHASSTNGTAGNIDIVPGITDGLVVGNVFSDSSPTNVHFDTGSGNTGWQFIGNSFSGSTTSGSRFANLPADAMVLSSGGQGVLNRLGSLVLASPSANVSTADTQLNAYGNDTVLSETNVSARFGLTRNSSGFDAALLFGSKSGNTPFIAARNGELTTAGAAQLLFNGTLAMTWDASGVHDKLPHQAKVYTVATLPTCNTTYQDAIAAVSDATSPTYNGSLTGGGTVRVPVYCNGTAWTSH
jgi:hypothetical protein